MHFSIPADHPCLPGHFPGHPLVPGVVVLEQVLLAAAAEHGQALSHLRLPQVKFLAPLCPGRAACWCVVNWSSNRHRADVRG